MAPLCHCAECVRLLLATAHVPLAAAPRHSQPSWSALLELRGPTGSSPALPLGALPVLTLPSGVVVTQSGAHARYAAKKAGLYPRDDDEKALFIDEIIGVAEDAQNKVPQGGDADAKKAARAAYVKDGLPKYFNYLSAKLGAGPFFGGAAINLADLAVFAITHAVATGGWDYVDGDAVLADYPALKAHHAALRAHPLVVAHGHLDAPKA